MDAPIPDPRRGHRPPLRVPPTPANDLRAYYDARSQSAHLPRRHARRCRRRLERFRGRGGQSPRRGWWSRRIKQLGSGTRTGRSGISSYYCRCHAKRKHGSSRRRWTRSSESLLLHVSHALWSRKQPSPSPPRSGRHRVRTFSRAPTPDPTPRPPGPGHGLRPLDEEAPRTRRGGSRHRHPGQTR